jgi:DNA-binding transcriptional LysR family regulator
MIGIPDQNGPTMDLRAMRYFVETVRQRSFTQAAAALNVTQSTVSKMVAQLESELGQPLLLREGRTLHLTDAGQVVFAQAQEALAVVTRMQRELGDLASLQQGALTVGIPPMVNVFFPELIQRFRARHPGVALRVHEAGGQVIEEMVHRGELDVGVSVLPLGPDQALAHAELGRYRLNVVGAVGVAWGRRQRLTVQQLHEQPIVLLGDDYSLTRRLHQAFDAAGVTPKVVARSDQWDFLLSMALSGMGAAILPQPLLQRQKLPAGTVVRPLVDKGLLWQVAHIWPRERYLSHAARAWLAVCREQAPQAGPLEA